MQKPSEMKFFPINFTLFLEKKPISSTQLLHLNTHQNIDMLYLNLQGMYAQGSHISSVFMIKVRRTEFLDIYTGSFVIVNLELAGWVQI